MSSSAIGGVWKRTAITAACVLACALAVGVSASKGLGGSLALLLAVGCILLLGRPQIFAYATILLAFTALPATVPFFVYLNGIQIYLYEPTLVLAFLWSLSTMERPWKYLVPFALTFAVATGWSLGGLLSGYAFSYINSDVRPLVDLALAVPVGARLAQRFRLGSLGCLTVALWSSAVLTVVASVTGLELAGREEAATLNFADPVGGDATRFLTTATDPATVVLCGCVALMFTQRVGWPLITALVAPSVVIVFLAFSRNTLLGLGMALTVATLWAISTGRASALARRATAVLFILAAAGSLTLLFPGYFKLSGWLGTQVDGFAGRVFGGVAAASLSSDPSAQYRSLEIGYLVPAFLQSPLLGHGFGFAYKPPLGEGLSFYSTQGRYYAHQYYLWLLVKVGLFGGLSVIGSWAYCALSAIRSREPTAVAMLAGLAGGLTISFVAPMPNGEPGALVVGAVVGAMAVSLAPLGKDSAGRTTDVLVGVGV